MSGEVRERMIEGAMGLLARGGPQAASFSDVLAATGAPRGSLYHHFPNGKRELIEAAVDRAGMVLTDVLSSLSGASLERVVEGFLAIWRTVLTRSQFEAGCAVVAVTVAADSEEQLAYTARVFQSWIDQLANLFREGGVSSREAHAFAVMLVASVEGAVALSRAERSLEPFETVARQLITQARTLSST
ncbi:TetR/AcrR family transcriptional regulator [Trinickia terrae]|uniref:TetR/AcrR family transcriptional regulator n=1 Tax=Trinickia terrae TaxID=2571161 RepID=A0A4U1IDD0_9BURK|nr:TetR/AcrR family transcriptional regulator [Trinickia terrae]TKC91663.1 TetR/AcrR family transcriptional regulator [Trinickia terrae]